MKSVIVAFLSVLLVLFTVQAALAGWQYEPIYHDVIFDETLSSYGQGDSFGYEENLDQDGDGYTPHEGDWDDSDPDAHPDPDGGPYVDPDFSGDDDGFVCYDPSDPACRPLDDWDADGFLNGVDNCALVANAQEDLDADGVGNACDICANTVGVVDSSGCSFAQNYILSVTPVSVTMYGSSGNTYTETITVHNAGAASVHNLALSHTFTDLSDDDGDEISLRFSPTNRTILASGASTSFNVLVTFDSGFDPGSESGEIVLQTAEGIEMRVPLTLISTALACEDGVSGDLVLSIENPEEDDEFTQGETISLDVDVFNNGSSSKNVLLEAVLFNTEINRAVDTVQSSVQRIEGDDTETLSVSLDVSGTAVQDGDSYVIYVLAYEKNEEEEQCTQGSVAVALEQLDEYLVLVQNSVHPSPVACGGSVEFDVTVENQGSDDLSSVFVEVFSAEFLGEGSSVSVDEGTRAQLVALAQIPLGITSGAHAVDLVIHYGDTTLSEMVTLDVVCGDSSVPLVSAVPPSVPYIVEGVATSSQGIPSWVLASANVLLLALAVLLVLMLFLRR